MNILFISRDLKAGNLAYLLKKEGHSVKLYIENKKERNNLDFFVEKTKNWKQELNWVGKDGLIVFDDIGFGIIQDKLRKKGYIVYGGSRLSDRLESEREESQNLFKKLGMKIKNTYDFPNVYEALEFVIKNPKAWVIKQNGDSPKSLNYVGYFEDGRDVISVLKGYLVDKRINHKRISLQEKVEGVEIAIGGYFNGKNWVGPLDLNIEHKKFMSGNIGPTTSEMGTLCWYDENWEKNKLYKETLEKMESYLKEIDFRGHFDLNCIINETGVYPLEATPRFGTPIVHAHSELQKSPWGELLYKIAKGENYILKTKKEYGIVLLLAIPPFPYMERSKKMFLHNPDIFFDKITKEEEEHLHFEEVSICPDTTNNSYYVSDFSGYILYVTSSDKDIKNAQKKLYNLVKKIIIPKVMYRNDIGQKFIEEDYPKLKKWGYID